MSNFLEAMLTLLPAEVGGRASHISPRDGSYRPFASNADGARLQIRVIEGPPSIAPGHGGRVVVELDAAPDESLFVAGSEFDLIEHERCVGILTVTRLWRAVPA